ncbi:hypothetical protein J6TS7_29040 [Paenibacillus dendritiformis]|uniref:hypothetical protein n=1 Tax=Paenibacillus TaxID=44249 RepID=UPI001B0A90CB|nr:hypothetical protein [Paenibacillus dendritiformis]GIO79294.1 hypothetical protein J6TS7_29040 [Paenibacillus dendritiformis]
MANPLHNAIKDLGIELKYSYRLMQTGSFFISIPDWEKPAIIAPIGVDLSSKDSQFSLAHEIGHWHHFSRLGEQQRKLHSIRNERWRKGSYGLIPWILYVEAKAWIEGYKICKRYEVQTSGYWVHAWRNFRTYFKRPVIQTRYVSQSLFEQIKKECPRCFRGGVQEDYNFCPHCGKEIHELSEPNLKSKESIEHGKRKEKDF